MLQNVLIKTSKPVDSDFFFQEALFEHQKVEKRFEQHNLFIIRVIWVFGTEGDCGGDEAIGGVCGDLDHDAPGDELVNTGPGHQVEEGPEQEEDEDTFDNWKYSSHKS